MEWWVILLLLGIGLVVLLSLGMPVAFSLGFLAVAAGFFLWPGGAGLAGVAIQAYGISSQFSLIAAPLFIFMAEVVMFSGMADDFFLAMHRWVGSLPGGLAIGGIAGCAGFAAITGSSSANTAAVGIVAVPEMLRRGYDKRLATGCIAAGGGLGILIPPSVPLIIVGVLGELNILKLFMAGFAPGFLLAGLYIIYIGIIAWRKPSLAPPLPGVSWKERLFSLRKTWSLILLALFLFWAMYSGFSTPSELAALGALAALIITTLYRKLSWNNLRHAMLRTAQTTCMVFWIFTAATIFGSILAYAEIPQTITAIMVSLPVSRWVIMILINILLLIMGCFLDPGAIIMITIPILMPVVVGLGFDPIWFSIIFVMNMEMGLITPPFGLNVYVMKGITPLTVSLGDIFRGVAPFVGLQAIGIAIVMVFPQIALWLPSTMS